MSEDPALLLAVALIAGFEGFDSVPYRDAGRGIWTYGYGFITTPDGHPVTEQTPPITRAAADTRLAADVSKVVASVRAMIYVPISSNAVAALVSFAWNEGTGALRKSSIMRMLNAGDPADAARYFDSYVFAGGKRLDGLVSRRAAEAALFLRPDGAEITVAGSTDDLNARELASLK